MPSPVTASPWLSWKRRTASGRVQLALGGTIDLRLGVISRSPIALNVQTEGFDLTRLQDRVVFLDNEINLDATAIPIPDPGEPLP